jgi:hypothetical protein
VRRARDAGRPEGTHETDPVTGVVLLLETAPVPVEILGEPVGTMVGRTMVRIEDGIRTV